MTSPARSTLQGAQDLDAARVHALRTLFAGVGLGSTGYIAAATVASIVAADLAGTATLAGLPATTVVLGSAFGSAWLAGLMARRGRRPGLVTGYVVGTLGALVALTAVLARSLPLFLAGTALLGFANSANQLSRYAAADMVAPGRRASTLSTVVWAGTIGGVLGPNLGTIAGQQLARFGVPELAGVYVVTLALVAAAALASWALLRPDPADLAWSAGATGGTIEGGGPPRGAGGRPSSVRQLLRRPTISAAVVALVTGQVVMTLIMTMTAVHMTEHGHDIRAVGIVISGHVFGMFALSPLSGRLTDRLGPLPVIIGGLSLSAGAAVLGAVTPPDGGLLLFVALFLLGFGWNLGFVAGSTLLSSGLASAERTRIQGITDALIWCSAAAASLGSGVLQAVAGFQALCVLGLVLAVTSALVLLARRHHAAAPLAGSVPGEQA